jgi:Spy/CpxP family protein refolding chaperone
MKHDVRLLLITALLALFGAPAVHAQQQPAPVPELQQQAPADAILQLNLSAEQREKIRTIREQTKIERAAINARLRETNLALEAALDADNPDEAVVEQRVRDVAAAQAAAMRMRILTEVKIRRVLTLEQLGFSGRCVNKHAIQDETSDWTIRRSSGGRAWTVRVPCRTSVTGSDRFFRAALYGEDNNPKQP